MSVIASVMGASTAWLFYAHGGFHESYTPVRIHTVLRKFSCYLNTVTNIKSKRLDGELVINIGRKLTMAVQYSDRKRQNFQTVTFINHGSHFFGQTNFPDFSSIFSIFPVFLKFISR